MYSISVSWLHIFPLTLAPVCTPCVLAYTGVIEETNVSSLFSWNFKNPRLTIRMKKVFTHETVKRKFHQVQTPFPMQVVDWLPSLLWNLVTLETGQLTDKQVYMASFGGLNIFSSKWLDGSLTLHKVWITHIESNVISYKECYSSVLSRGIMIAQPFLSWVIVSTIGSITTVLALPPTEPPLIHNHPFVAIWNAPTERCQQFHIPLDAGAFQAFTTPAAVPGQFLTIFYEDRLGLYPKADIINRKRYKGGIPQNSNLTEHLAKAQNQINHYISPDSSPGLVVIDWESWRPLWDQNWGSKRIYQKLSLAYALEMSPFLSSKYISELAKNQFQKASRRFMERTLSLGTGERPSRRWGFYLFPDCFNYGWDKPEYTGKCSVKTQKQNNQMLWLWERSTALFPSVYLHLALRNSPQATLFVRNRVLEALRVASLPKRPYTVPIYVYSRPLYRDQTEKFQSKVS